MNFVTFYRKNNGLLVHKIYLFAKSLMDIEGNTVRTREDKKDKEGREN